ncbi:MAG: Bax inhibitor-1/YccA family protein [Bacteroidales bacterium]|nr:Bax inhibitor-1/YccA family protein [Bacteroidales bacterium]
MEFNNQPAMSAGMSVSLVMRQVYVKMFLALVVSTITAFLCVTTPAFMSLMLSSQWIYLGCCVLELVMVIALTGRIAKGGNPAIATLMFYLFAILNGLTLSVLLLVYTTSSVVATFGITAGVFGAMSLYGYFTDRDLTGLGTFLFMGVIGLIICSVVNIFLKSTQMEWIISFAGVAIFIGLTAWDTQKIKTMLATCPVEQQENVATWGALSLYLDFINLFIYLLRFFGNRD